MSLAGNKRSAASPGKAEGEDDAQRHVRPANGGGPGSSSGFTVKRLTIPTEASPGQMLLESPLLLPGLLVRFAPHFIIPSSRELGALLGLNRHEAPISSLPSTHNGKNIYEVYVNIW